MQISTIAIAAENIACSICGKSRKTSRTPKNSLRLPKGWKPGPTCAACQKERYVLRAVAFPVQECVDAPWSEFTAALRHAWNDTTSTANWIMRELYLRDVRRMPGMEKLPPMPKVYLYPEAKEVAPGLYRSCVAALEQQGKAKYKASRFELVWRQRVSLPTFRWPVPYGVPNQNYHICYSENSRGQPLVTANIQGRRFTLRLRGGDEFRRQLKGFSHLLANPDCRGELSLYRVPANNCNRRTVQDRRNGGGRNESWRIMCKLAGWLPRMERSVQSERGMTISTSPDHFVVAQADHAGQPFIINADHVRRLRSWILAHADYLQRMSEDTKYEKRNPPSQQLHMNESRSMRCVKNANRVKTAMQQIVASLIGYAVRQHVTSISYDDSDRSCMPSFPWFIFRKMLGDKCDHAGIAISDVVKTEEAEEEKEEVAE